MVLFHRQAFSVVKSTPFPGTTVFLLIFRYCRSWEARRVKWYTCSLCTCLSHRRWSSYHVNGDYFPGYFPLTLKLPALVLHAKEPKKKKKSTCMMSSGKLSQLGLLLSCNFPCKTQKYQYILWSLCSPWWEWRGDGASCQCWLSRSSCSTLQQY